MLINQECSRVGTNLKKMEYKLSLDTNKREGENTCRLPLPVSSLQPDYEPALALLPSLFDVPLRRTSLWAGEYLALAYSTYLVVRWMLGLTYTQ